MELNGRGEAVAVNINREDRLKVFVKNIGDSLMKGGDEIYICAYRRPIFAS